MREKRSVTMKLDTQFVRWLKDLAKERSESNCSLLVRVLIRRACAGSKDADNSAAAKASTSGLPDLEAGHER